MNRKDLLLDQVELTLDPLSKTPFPATPRGGWLKLIRAALGMTTRQAAEKSGITQPALLKAERSEAAGTISLAHLRRLANALDCDVHYVVVPRTRLSQTIENQAERIASARVKKAAHTMGLEQQATSDDFNRKQIERLKADLLRGKRSVLWR